ncbi:uncharacterized protein DUF1080 [Roseimicrobium gellanilyticum]|uniref:Uncharacterized protein DUF1080 n=1 Tax=Roseimicrobium gellanilyticum TaxID=748857 RepID=A0A366H5H9_9BACT|nr:DUF1080 domain-containing protein [Roseimicrobium gellanilyticum]RBP36902.1 uncharacterized protein DUF1080 [Roseimicrobium gellanilyticum]
MKIASASHSHLVTRLTFFLTSALLLTATTFTHAAEPAATDWTPEPGFKSLFNGKDLSGWHYQGEPDLGTATKATDERYSAKDGILAVNPEDKAKGPKLRQLWMLENLPKHFVLKLQFRASVNADSGIFIRDIKNQLQCRDYLVAGPFKELKQYKPQEWNDIEITVTGGAIKATCNGEVLPAPLKIPESGPLGLEADRNLMEYRHIQVKELAE